MRLWNAFDIDCTGALIFMSLYAMNHRELCDKTKSFLGAGGKDSSVTHSLARNSTQSGIISSGHGLCSPAEAIIRGVGTLLEGNTKEVAIFEKPEDFVTVEGCPDDRERQYGSESMLMDNLLKDIKLVDSTSKHRTLCSIYPFVIGRRH